LDFVGFSLTFAAIWDDDLVLTDLERIKFDSQDAVNKGLTLIGEVLTILIVDVKFDIFSRLNLDIVTELILSGQISRVGHVGQHSADMSYTAYLTAKDEFGNNVKIQSAKDIELDINDQNGEDLAYESQALVDGVLRVKFDPLKIGEYQVVVPDGCKGERKAYKIQVIPGDLDTVQSLATVDVDSNADSNVFVAGSTISFVAQGKDKQGNVIDYQNKLDKFKLFAAYNQEGSTLLYTEMTQKQLVEVNGVKQVKWTLPLTKSGEYELFAAYDDKKVRCDVCKVVVKPDVFSFESSTMEYLDPWMMYNLEWKITEKIYEEN
jgi:hypothetical protein